MQALPDNIDDCIQVALIEVSALVHEAFAKVGHQPPVGSALDQAGLSDGSRVVKDYLGAGEPGLALEHIIYMAYEPGLKISLHAYECIERAGQKMRMDKLLWEQLRHEG
jgi:hypothetical protein